jgi:hypothetical protein
MIQPADVVLCGPCLEGVSVETMYCNDAVSNQVSTSLNC